MTRGARSVLALAALAVLGGLLVVAATGLEGEPEVSLSPESLHRTHPAVQGLASQVLSAALDARLPQTLRIARRAGVIRTPGVKKRTTLLLFTQLLPSSALPIRPVLRQLVNQAIVA